MVPLCGSGNLTGQLGADRLCLDRRREQHHLHNHRGRRIPVCDGRNHGDESVRCSNDLGSGNDRSRSLNPITPATAASGCR